MVLKTRGVVTGGVAQALHFARVEVLVNCLALVCVVQMVRTQSLQAMHRTEPLYFLLLVMCWKQMGHT